MTNASGAASDEQRAVEPVRLEVAQPLRALVLLAHADPRVGDDDVGALHCLARVATTFSTPAAS